MVPFAELVPAALWGLTGVWAALLVAWQVEAIEQQAWVDCWLPV